MAPRTNTTKVETSSIHWFRHGLRLHDNAALLQSIKHGGEVYPIFILDGEVAGTKTSGYNRWRFLLECLQDLDNQLKDVGGRLFVFRGDPVQVLENLFVEWNVGQLTFEQDPEPVWQERDDQVRQLCDDKRVEWVEKISHTLWDPNEIIEANGGKPPLTYLLFNQVSKSIGDPPRPVTDADFSGVKIPVCKDHEQRFGIPSLGTLNVKRECKQQDERINKWLGGETQALKLFDSRLKVEKMAFTCGKVMPNQSFPELVGPPLSMSAHLRFGCLSIRKLYWALHDAYVKINSEKTFNLSVIGQLIWREYFYTMSVNNVHYNEMENNPICLNIPWYKNDEHLKKWFTGETGYPWIDAIMKQLHYEGWVHHVARHAVSTFLTRGDLWLNWEDGLKVFDKLLIDADWSVNAGNWMWISSSAFENVFQCSKCFCPVRYGRRMEPSGEYIRRYLPVLKDMPLRYLWDPWKAPKAVQEKAKCVVGIDYPHPMVEHNKASKECLNLMTEVKNKLEACGEGIEYCGPANREEVRRFSWISMNHCDDRNGKLKNCEDDLCDGLEAVQHVE